MDDRGRSQRTEIGGRRTNDGRQGTKCFDMLFVADLLRELN